MNITSCSPVIIAEKYSHELANYDRILKIVTSTINLTASIPISLLNMLILWTIFKNSSLQTPSYIFIFSLALADFGTGLLSLSYDSSWKINVLTDSNVNVCGWYFSVGFSISFVLISVSELTVTALSVDRYLAIRLGPRYRVLVTNSRVIKVVFILWSVASVWGITSVIVSARVIHTTVVIVGVGTFAAITTCYYLSYKALFALENKTSYGGHLDGGKEQKNDEKMEQKLEENQEQSDKRKVSIFVYPRKHSAVVQSATNTMTSGQNTSEPFHIRLGIIEVCSSILELDQVSRETRLTEKGTCSMSNDCTSSVKNHGNDLVLNIDNYFPDSLTAERSSPKAIDGNKRLENQRHLETSTDSALDKHQTDLVITNRLGARNWLSSFQQKSKFTDASRKFRNRNKMKLVKYRHTMVTLSCVIVGFLLCSGSYFILSCAVAVFGMTKELAVAWSGTLTCLCLNSMLNPLIYFCRFRDLKKACVDTLRKLR